MARARELAGAGDAVAWRDFLSALGACRRPRCAEALARGRDGVVPDVISNSAQFGTLLTPTPPASGQFTGLACASSSACTAVGYTIRFSAISSLGGRILAERWTGTTWHIQPRPVLPVAHDISNPAVACPARNTCTSVGGYENDGPTSVTLAERWHGSGAKTQPAARPSNNTSLGVACARPLAALVVLMRTGLIRTSTSAPNRSALSLSGGRRWTTMLRRCGAL